MMALVPENIRMSLSRKWQSLPQRDQNALLVLGVALALFIAVFGIWRPAAQFAESARADAEQARADYVWMKEREAFVRALRQSGSSQANGRVLTIVNQEAGRYGIELKRFEPRGENRLNVWLESIPFDKVVLWLSQLGKQGIQVRQISVDQAGQPGLVNVRLSLER